MLTDKYLGDVLIRCMHDIRTAQGMHQGSDVTGIVGVAIQRANNWGNACKLCSYAIGLGVGWWLNNLVRWWFP